ncbi:MULTISPECIES: tRNA uridine-5-carboxymethylaminomethyl(34) synthesis GTPase MnmE [Flavobacteriaceae]|uniref:tRNA modification GTPase MnmE n=2 Tax=Flavobacteriaceae TaxID=49546 RepID=A0A4Y8AVM1_9FLAO|nr:MULTISPECIES: tRNA uridine-5-carboxymethylaminomethyl(34) synthesis GTPase MnmE [Flavobacteriaceae]TEW76529.1 tRNA uridine-5-carboxymethylaminomethyl(34) synthesis GTPase MnmE [Gramella jeungdoensis]GGK53702.1 tRNA modification GTPase MnmE [Lutibacter litoralis]
MIQQDTIIALATPSGVGAIAVIRLSGEKSIEIVNQFFKSKSGKRKLTEVKSHTIHLGNIIENDRIIDEVLISVFKNPKSYTGENVVEINCHGSVYIQQEIIQLFLQNGVRNADAGEFTLRAFLNGKMDLSQAEAVADLISSNSAASHQVALQQMRGGFSTEIKNLRQQLLNFASLIELELDFAEEDVEFADRSEFKNLIDKISAVLKRLIDSFALGNVLKNGIPIAIVGEPNVGKSTLLNALLNEEKAIVSHIAGTTRDAIEDEINIEGVAYRFIDTAGIRTTEDFVENIGIQKTFENIEKAQLVLQLIDASNINMLEKNITELDAKYPSKEILTIVNKADLLTEKQISTLKNKFENLIILSAKHRTGIQKLTETLTHLVNKGALSNNETIVSNSRHFEALNNAYNSIKEVQKGLDLNISTDLFAIDIRQALFHLGEITGEVTTEDLLGNIFANFCIGK